jgi:hypothetical protein
MQRGRLSQQGDGHGVMAFAWFVWDHAHWGEPTIGWLDWKASGTSGFAQDAQRLDPKGAGPTRAAGDAQHG